MQPAALTASPPSTISPTSSGVGGALGVSHRLQPAGINKIRRPLGLCQRTSSNQSPSLVPLAELAMPHFRCEAP